ncbi:hypothetical protein [Chromobacterium sp. IIBBL 290-4]|uniref:hypothetical protein n=1 Tax=Chromobacterium sp. IIBBL 290-4 TaxID=2953890 RepID=UPI0020B6CB35|nr:hypothetical protein [Chromobacterium sp. IIBBL 290-4]UTH73078.1 hypothetical protein NKT35_16250 [Chromobacterium sp. IIBBL 290-4]
MMKLIGRMQRSRKLTLAILVVSTALFMALSALWQGGAVGNVALKLLCPVLLVVALAGQLSALCILLQKPRK